MPQAMGNAVTSCIHTAHTKYESNPLDWQRVVEIGYRLFTRQDMVRFQEMCEDGLLGPGDYGIFEDWSAIDRSRDGYIHIRDGLVSEGEIQEMNDKEIFLQQGAIPGPCLWIFLGVPPGTCLLLVALVPSDGLGALLRVQGKSGSGNVYPSLVDIFCSNGKIF
jgi:hypothetical protein